MATRTKFLAFLFLCSATLHCGETKSLLELAPTATELGGGWEDGKVMCLIDPLSEPSEIVREGHSNPQALISFQKDLMKTAGQDAYLETHYHHSVMINTECRLYLQRWPSPEAVPKASSPNTPEPGRSPPHLGDWARWGNGGQNRILEFRLDRYLVVIDARYGYEKQMLRIGQVIEAKLSGKPTPTSR